MVRLMSDVLTPRSEARVFRAGKYMDPVNGETTPAKVAMKIILSFSDLEKTEKRLSECGAGSEGLPSMFLAGTAISSAARVS